MHSGINTGLVVTGEVDIEKGTHGVPGDGWLWVRREKLHRALLPMHPVPQKAV